jgi:hypothetical protein
MVFTEMRGMHARADSQRIDVRVQRVEKICADAVGLHLLDEAARRE